MNVSFVDTIAMELEGTAHWRAEKAAQYLEDTRNLAGAELAGRLAKEVRALAGAEVAKRLQDLHDSIFYETPETDGEDDVGHNVCQAWSSYRSNLGSRAFPEDGSEYLSNLIQLAEEVVAR